MVMIGDNKGKASGRICVYKGQSNVPVVKVIQATLLNPDMCNPDFRLNRTDRKVPVPSYTYNSYTHNPNFA